MRVFRGSTTHSCHDTTKNCGVHCGQHLWQHRRAAAQRLTFGARYASHHREQRTLVGDLERNTQTVVAGFDTVRQIPTQLIVVKVMRHVCQDGPTWFQTRGPLDGLIDAQMSRVWFLPQCIDDQSIQVLQLLTRFSGNCGDIRAERDISDAETKDSELSVMQPQRQDFQPQQIKLLSGFNSSKRQSRRCETVTVPGRVRKGIVKHSANALFNRSFTVQWDIAVQRLAVFIGVKRGAVRLCLRFRGTKQFLFETKAEDPQVIEPHNVIRMSVRKNCGSDHRHLGCDQLKPKLRTRVKHELTARSSDKDSGTKSTIAGI